MLLGNNILLMAGMLVVLLGTLVPLVHKQLGLGSISVGEPFFNNMFMWIMVPFALLLGIGPLVRWRKDEPAKFIKRFVIAVIATVVGALALPYLFDETFDSIAFIGFLMAVWVFVLAFMEVYERATHRHGFVEGLKHLPRSYWGMVLAHLGVAVTIIGVAFSQNYSVERDVRMKINDTAVKIHDYEFTLKSVDFIQGPNYTSDKAHLEVVRKGKLITKLTPEKRYYSVASSMMTEASINAGITRDIYAALGERLDNQSWSFRLYYKPFVRWIWFGGLFMAFGGLLCILDPRYRFNHKAKQVKQ